MVHEMLHAWLYHTGRNPEHDSEDWYSAVRQLSPAILGRQLDARRGAHRKSVRVPNPTYESGNGEPKTLVRKVPNLDAVDHSEVATWPVRPPGYDYGETMACPSY